MTGLIEPLEPVLMGPCNNLAEFFLVVRMSAPVDFLNRWMYLSIFLEDIRKMHGCNKNKPLVWELKAMGENYC